MGEGRQDPRGTARGTRVEDAAGDVLRCGSVGVHGVSGGED
jgi:hypothetical protein